MKSPPRSLSARGNEIRSLRELIYYLSAYEGLPYPLGGRPG